MKECGIRMTKEESERWKNQTVQGGQNVESDEKGKRRVFYISLLAADKFGKVRNEYFPFDIASKMDLQHTEVEVMDCEDLIENYLNELGRDLSFENLPTVYELAESFVKNNPGGSFFIDECPFLASSSTYTLGNFESNCLFLLNYHISKHLYNPYTRKLDNDTIN